MVFKRLLGSLGVGGPTVDTVLDADAVLPGGRLTGQIRLSGGRSDVMVEQLALELVAGVASGDDGGPAETAVLDRFPVGGGFRLAEGERWSLSFEVTLPWETPLTELHGQRLGVALGVRTELVVAGARDRGDLDPLVVRPLPAQEAVLEALGQLGCGFRSAGLEYGRLHGTGQRLPVRQEIELTPPPRYTDRVDEIELTFLAESEGLDVILEADRRSRSGEPDAIARFTAGHHDAGHRDWGAEVDSWLRRLTGSGTPGSAPDAYAHTDAHHGHHAHRSGPGAGTVVAAGAAGLAVGVAGGLIAAEVVDEIGDLIEGDEEEGAEEEG
ncbi:sporulation protein [Streptomyces sp. NPDC001985]|uniref:sporulation protein n=1 Tax=Streptomyces sp. NPDC001985 TaxID=3154406 RepID=UPI003321369B